MPDPCDSSHIRRNDIRKELRKVLLLWAGLRMSPYLSLCLVGILVIGHLSDISYSRGFQRNIEYIIAHGKVELNAAFLNGSGVDSAKFSVSEIERNFVSAVLAVDLLFYRNADLCLYCTSDSFFECKGQRCA